MKALFILSLIFLMAIGIAGAVEPDIFIVVLNYNHGEISFDSITLAKGYSNTPINQPDSEYRLEVVSTNNKILYTQNFSFNLEVYLAPLPEWFDEEGNQIYIPKRDESRIVKTKSSIELLFPYFKNARTVNIYYGSRRVLSADISKFTQIKASSLKTEKNDDERYILYMGLAVLLIIIIVFMGLSLHFRHRGKPPRGINY